MKIYPIRLLKALVYSGASLFFIFHEYGTDWLGADEPWGESLTEWGNGQSSFVEGLMEFLIIAVTVTALIYLVKGVYYFITVHVDKHPVFENSFREKFSPPCSGYDGEGSGIERMKVYRESVLTSKMNEGKITEFKKTAWLDGLTSDSGNHTQATKRYIDAKLSCKTNEEGYRWLSGDVEK